MKILQNDELLVRNIHKDDITLLGKWLSNPKVLEFYEGRDKHFDYEKIDSKFLDRSDNVNRCIVEYEGNKVGYIQFYTLDHETKSEYGYKNNELIFGLDQFIGEVELWNQGIGRKLIQSVTTYLIENHEADIVVMDPQKSNMRAIKCYEKCHFIKVKELHQHELHEGEFRDCYLMEYKV
ncbi:GNAT family N-acetyltransferase [Pontibacillus sp. HMF3514]|uniref:GNAT family N-acetyltransferase n=1 Tax=Pontibacillus sp. HMF3514 TaxID=2692425 RepID=UPI00131F71E5|nr:GNAT family N-acetyltransferase [Pontibacillus sp. HMF3514]QHE53355.1 GNAT family N-acetyltransferase [Pontibacillus sp. HMF3514]